MKSANVTSNATASRLEASWKLLRYSSDDDDARETYLLLFFSKNVQLVGNRA